MESLQLDKIRSGEWKSYKEVRKELKRKDLDPMERYRLLSAKDDLELVLSDKFG